MEPDMVDIVVVEKILGDIKSNVSELRQATDITWEIYRTDKRSRRFVERTLHILIEACIDVAQHIISDEQLREPTSYRDTFAVLAENGIIQADDLSRMENMSSFRNLIVHYYERIDDAAVYGFLKRNLSDFDIFVQSIVEYLKKMNSKNNTL